MRGHLTAVKTAMMTNCAPGDRTGHRSGQASVSYIQRKFRVGYARAGRIIDQMEARGIIAARKGANPGRFL